MEHFIILEHQKCIESLADHDICGVNWNLQTLGPHFSGNFWWARSRYIQTLPPIDSLTTRNDTAGRHNCERWIGMNRSVRAATVHQSETNHYENEYPRSRYARIAPIVGHGIEDIPSAWKGLENRFQDLIEIVNPIHTVLEIGVEYGYSLYCLATAVPSATVIGIDPYETLLGDQHRSAPRNLHAPGLVGTAEAEDTACKLMQHCPRAILLKTTSANAAQQFVGQVDIVHIDALHTYDDVRSYFEHWEPKLRPGGCILFHDTQSYPNDVGRFFRELSGRKAEIRDCHGLGAWYKPRNGHQPTIAHESPGTLKRRVMMPTKMESAAL